MKDLWLIPHEFTPNEDHLKAYGIRSIKVFNDLKPYARPVLIIEWAEGNDRAGLKDKSKVVFEKKPNTWIKGKPKILAKLLDICTNIEQ